MHAIVYSAKPNQNNNIGIVSGDREEKMKEKNYRTQTRKECNLQSKPWDGQGKRKQLLF